MSVSMTDGTELHCGECHSNQWIVDMSGAGYVKIRCARYNPRTHKYRWTVIPREQYGALEVTHEKG